MPLPSRSSRLAHTTWYKLSLCGTSCKQVPTLCTSHADHAVWHGQMSDLDAKYRVSEQATAAMRVHCPALWVLKPHMLSHGTLFSILLPAQATGQAASRTAAALGSSMRFVSSKALENERVRGAPPLSLAAHVGCPCLGLCDIPMLFAACRCQLQPPR